MTVHTYFAIHSHWFNPTISLVNFEGFAALNGTVISGDVYAWVIVFVLPVNSALNPILFTISSLDIVKVCESLYVCYVTD